MWKMRRMRGLLALMCVVAFALGGSAARGQAPAAKPDAGDAAKAPDASAPPPILWIEREVVKSGGMEAHTEAVRKVLATYEKGKLPIAAIALSTAIGDENEMVYLVAFDSFHAIDDLEAQFGKAPPDIIQDLVQHEQEESAQHASKRTMVAVYRPDLSYRPDATVMARATVVSTFQHIVHFGHEKEYSEEVSFLTGALEKAGVDWHWFTYQVVSGAPTGTYIRIQPMKSMGDWDAHGQQVAALSASLDDAGRERMWKLWGSTILQAGGDEETPISRLYAIRPDQSHVSDGFAALNPQFWRPKQKE
jgi:hypothetical protein